MPTAKRQPQPSFEAPNLSLPVASLLPSPVLRILFVLSSQGHDPTEVVAVWSYLTKEEGWEVHFATETGELAKADSKLMERGLFRTVLGAKNAIVEGWYEMAGSREFIDMKRFGGEEQGKVDFADYDAVYLPGGHDKTMIPYFLSKPLHSGLVNYIPSCARKTSPITKEGQSLTGPIAKPQHVIAAICHGVLPLAFSQYPADYPNAIHAGKSVLHNLETSTLPMWMESVAWGVSQVWRMGEYYRTFSEGVAAHTGEQPQNEGEKKGEVEYTEDIVKKVLDDPESQYKRGPLGPGSFTHTDPTYHYISARFPGDAKDLAIGIAREIRAARQRFVDEVAAGVYDGLIA
ncbi:hypothetical protein EV426DRAFT_708393 [Tirmania nivea]|nr:hypothetical protein EV426DRAFT_708393 [Tirmania nivea]